MDDRDRLSELVSEGCVLSSRTYREIVETRDPCNDPSTCWGDCESCRSEPSRLEYERTRIVAFRDGVVVWETWV